MENIEARGCGTGNWCCTVANPSTYCINYCRAGSEYLNCGASYVSAVLRICDSIRVPLVYFADSPVRRSARRVDSASASATMAESVPMTVAWLRRSWKWNAHHSLQ